MHAPIQRKMEAACCSRTSLDYSARSCRSIVILRMICVLFYFGCELARASDGILFEPEKAFRFSARTVDATRVEVFYKIAPGYAMYRDRFRFELEPRDVVLGAPQMPPGIMKDDPFIGKTVVFRDEVRILLPLMRTDPAARDIKLKVTSQGCADVGVCYVPQEDQMSLKLPTAFSATSPPRVPTSDTR